MRGVVVERIAQDHLDAVMLPLLRVIVIVI
jgi:hypothetical protein